MIKIRKNKKQSFSRGDKVTVSGIIIAPAGIDKFMVEVGDDREFPVIISETELKKVETTQNQAQQETEQAEVCSKPYKEPRDWSWLFNDILLISLVTSLLFGIASFSALPKAPEYIKSTILNEYQVSSVTLTKEKSLVEMNGKAGIFIFEVKDETPTVDFKPIVKHGFDEDDEGSYRALGALSSIASVLLIAMPLFVVLWFLRK
jgi:hypothetical protein